jgi:hypothetical protein
MKYTAPMMERNRVAGRLGARSGFTCASLGVLCVPGSSCVDGPSGPECIPN